MTFIATQLCKHWVNDYIWFMILLYLTLIATHGTVCPFGIIKNKIFRIFHICIFQFINLSLLILIVKSTMWDHALIKILQLNIISKFKKLKILPKITCNAENQHYKIRLSFALTIRIY